MPVRILFSGDFAPIISSDNIGNDHFDGLMQIIDDTDLHVTNLECPLTLSETRIQKSGPHLKAHPQSACLLKQAKVNISCLANNHIFDYGEKGITDTITRLDEFSIESIGIINRTDGRKHWVIKEIRNIRIGILDYCEHESSVREDGFIGACGYDYSRAFQDISELRSQVDWIIVIYHCGNEYYPLPSPGLKKEFHFLADLGADAVVGHHTHVNSGFEIYKDKPLIYSLGNFFFPYPGEREEWHQGLLCTLDIGEKINCEFKHIIQCKNSINTRCADREEDILLHSRFNNLSRTIQTDMELIEHWKEFVGKHGKGLRTKILFPGRIEKLALKLGFCKSRLERVRSVENIIRCNSLRNLLLDSLKKFR